MASPVAAVPSAYHLPTSLPARPPTPPREAGHDIENSLKPADLARSHAFDPHNSLQTPPNALSPVSSATNDANPSSSRAHKRVEWSSHTEYEDASDYRDCGRSKHTSTALCVPPAASSRPAKGILKPSPYPISLSSPLGTHLESALAQPSLIEMLDSAIQQLAGSDRHCKLDAYMMLERALKASDNLPDRIALQNKMSLLTQFIQRDITSRSEQGVPDSSLVNHALKLLATFLHFSAIASTISLDFGRFIMDHAIRAYEDPTTPKDTTRHLMQVVAFQTFPPKVMTPDRVGRLIAAVHKIEKHLQGKSIIMSRLYVYKRLVKQAPSSMITHSDWLKDMFTDMLSTVREIRGQAINLGIEAGFALRSSKPLLRKVIELLKTAHEDETYIDFFISRLHTMVESREFSSAVPQIWSAVTLFLRCLLDRWHYYGPWLTLVQKAFNKADGPTRQEANHAWNRYAYLSIIDSNISSKTLKTLCQPLLSQLTRKTSSRQHDEALKLRETVFGGICSLYYYALARSDDKCSTDNIWDVAIQPVVIQLVSFDGRPDAHGDFTMQAARMLTSLLDVSTLRSSYNPDRILDTTPLKPEELLPIDSKWVRRNCDKIFEAAGPVLQRNFLDLANEESLSLRLWTALVGSIAAASAKDIKVSEDTTKFLARSLSLLTKLWTHGCDEHDDSACPKFFSSVTNFTRVLADGLGIFMERKLYRSALNEFETMANSPTRSMSGENSWGYSRTALEHLFLILSSVPPGCADDDALAHLFRSVFAPFLKGRTGKARADIARDFIQLLPRNALSPYGPWLLAAENMTSCWDGISKFSAGPGAGAAGCEKLLGPYYRDLVSLLERGITCHPQLPTTEWKRLFDLVSLDAFQELGDAGWALVVVEPLAKIILDHFPTDVAKSPTMFIRVMTMLLGAARLPPDRTVLDTARMRLWGAPPATAKVASSDPFDNLYRLVVRVMETLYTQFADVTFLLDLEAFVSAVDVFFERCPSLAFVKTISRMQHGLCPWVQDKENRLDDQSAIFRPLCRLWDRINLELSSLGQLGKQDVTQLEPFMTAAFKSTHACIVDKSIEMWNTLVKDEVTVECSESLKANLSSLRFKIGPLMPGSDSTNRELDGQVLPVLNYPGAESFVAWSSAASRRDSGSGSMPWTSSAQNQSMKRKRLEDLSAEAAEQPAKKRCTPRLRHDNSQVQFLVIPPSSENESQHLTERQKEVHESKRDNACLYSDTHSESRQSSAEVGQVSNLDAPECDRKEEVANDSTPKHCTSFDDVVRSTPTPRRGQVLPMVDCNDPPSSPPVPGPCLLLSEIQSRSRANTSLDNWEFSSPIGSPVASQEKASPGVELAGPARRRPLSPPKTRAKSRRRRRATAKARACLEVISSSIADDEGDADKPAGDEPHICGPSRTSTALPRGHRVPPHTRVPHKQDWKKKESKDVKSSPERPLFDLEALNSNNDSKGDTNCVSFATSEGEDHDIAQLVIELESRRLETSASEAGNTPGKKIGSDHPILPRELRTRSGSKRLASHAVASIPAKKAEGNGTRKRTRSSESQAQSREKRRRSSSPEAAARATIVVKNDAPASARQRKNSGQMKKESKRNLGGRKPGTRNRTSSKTATSREGSDTEDCKSRAGSEVVKADGEAASQMVATSFPTCQRGQPRELGKSTSRVTRSATKPGRAKAPDTTEDKAAEAMPQKDKTAQILGTLRSGLEQLCQAALTRQGLYEVEDVLMDMKREPYEAEKRGRKGMQDRA